MELPSVYLGLPTPNCSLCSNRTVLHQTVTASHARRLRNRIASKSHLVPGLKVFGKKSSMLCLNKGAIMCSSNPSLDGKLEFSRERDSNAPSNAIDAVEPFRGKSGSISFSGLTHQIVEEGKLLSAPFNEENGSFLWFLGPAALIVSFIFPQFFIGNAVEGLQDEILVGFKVVAPLVAVYVTWPILGLPALAAVAPFLVGCAAQLAFERVLDKRGSSCWPLVPIIFEVYRLYQLTKADYFIKKLMYAMNGLPTSPELLEKGGALFAMEVTVGTLCVVCLWSLVTFLLRLFPSRPVAEKY